MLVNSPFTVALPSLTVTSYTPFSYPVKESVMCAEPSTTLSSAEVICSNMADLSASSSGSGSPMDTWRAPSASATKMTKFSVTSSSVCVYCWLWNFIVNVSKFTSANENSVESQPSCPAGVGSPSSSFTEENQ